MRNKHTFKRLLCLMLALFMVIGLMPVNIRAAEYGEAVDAAIIFTDLHTSKSDYKESTVRNIFGTLKNTGLPFSSVTSGGDAFSVNEDSSSSNGPYTGDPTKITGYIQSALGVEIPVNYVWSDHDRYATGIDKKSRLVEYDNYYIYLLSMGDLCSYDRYSAGFNYTQSDNSGRVSAGFTATVPQAISEFEAAAAELDKSKPLFIVSHQPLFDNRNDNAWAELWFDAINAVAAEMDVAFFYGHNHKYDVAGDYYYAKGDTLPVATMDNWGWDYQIGSGWKPNVDLSSEGKALNFTHMCGGYMAPDSTGSTSSTTRSGTVMVITIYDDSIRYTTYNSSGIYTGNYAVDKTVTRDHAVTEPELTVTGADTYFLGEELDITVSYKVGSTVTDVTAEAAITGFDANTAGEQTVTVSYEGLTARMIARVFPKVFTDAASGITVEVSEPGATALTVTAVDVSGIEGADALLSRSVGYDIRLADAVGGAEITLPIPDGVDTAAVCHVSEDGTVSRVAVSENGTEAVFTTAVFGTFLIGQEEITEELENTVIGGTTVYEEKTVYAAADSFVNGGRYLIVGENKATGGDLIAYLNNSGSEGWEVVTPDADGCIEQSNANAIWTASGSDSDGYTLTNNGRYIGGTDANTLKSSSSEAVKVIYDASAVRLKTASGTTRYLYYSTYGSENWKWSTSANSSTSARAMHIYQEETVRVPVSSPVTYSLQAEDLHHVLSSDSAALSFALLADGTVADLPEGAVWGFEVKKDESGIIESVSDEGVITFSNAVGSCYVKISCALEEGTVYKYVKISTEADPNACDHSYTAVTTDATCTENGSVVYTCECGESYTEVIPATGHSYETAVTAPTCTEDGFTAYTCANCGDSYIADEIAALGHSYETAVTAPTCTEDGFTAYTCANCGDSYIADEIAALGHSYTAVTTDATCTENGSIVYTCECGESYTEVIPATGHSYDAVTTDATCTENGSVVYTCECGESYTEVIPATGHSYDAVTTDATCTEDGFTAYTCACGDSYIADEIAALGHSYERVTVEPTCTDGGYTALTCVHCGDATVTDETAALGHAYTAVTTEATCEKAGYTTHTCGNCGDIYVTDEIAALGHELSTVTVDATCTADGSVAETCERCGETFSEVIPALGHAMQTVTVGSTCTADGSVTETCERCGETSTEIIPALGHSYDAVTTDATCTADGSSVYTCTVCGEGYTEVIPALGHAYTSVTVEATCENGGYTTHTCANCGDSYVTDETAALGHSYTSVTTDATCTENGSTVYTCACGEDYTEVVPATGHAYTSVTVEATCENAGYTTHTCANCGDSYVTDEIAALGHSYTAVEENGWMVYTCVCGHSYSEKLTSSYSQVDAFTAGENYVLTVNSNGTYYALSHSGNGISTVQVTVQNGEITSEITADLLWSCSDGKLSYVDNGTTYYLYTYTTGWWWWWSTPNLGISTSQAATVSISGTSLKVDSYYLNCYNGSIGVSYYSSAAYLFEEN